MHPRLIILLLCAALAFCAAPPEFDLVVRGGEVLDGTGQEALRVDVGIAGDRITAIGDLSERRAGETIDAAGKVVAPGFIDTQGQSGTTLLADGNGESHIRQGITSEIIGEGSSPAFWTKTTADVEALQRFGLAFDWTTPEGYFDTLEDRGISINLGTLVPATMARREVVGLENRTATADELRRMEELVDRAMRAGAFGLSSALIYPPGSYADTSELVALARVASRHKGVYVSHVRGESFRVEEAVAEAIRIGDEAKLPVVIFHLKVAARPQWGSMGKIGAMIAAAIARGQLVSATQYPYTAGGTGLLAVLPGWAQEGGRPQTIARLNDPSLRARIRREIETTIDGWENLVAGAGFEGIQIASLPPQADPSLLGKRLSQIAAERGEDPWDTLFRLLVETDGRVGALYHMMSEDDVRTAMQYGFVTIGTDAAALRPDGELGRGQPHPRAYGTFPRVLGRYVREHQVIELREAVRRMTSLAAAQYNIPRRGILREGYYADLVVFDPATVIDRATYEAPHQYPAGIDYVIVNGVVTITPAGHTGARAGRRLAGPGARPTGS
ncbi:MAG: N-acyl-D-amino-acid deacylase family protein [Vicinamibacterales bacterium]